MARDVLKAGADVVARLRETGDSGLLRELFAKRTERWKHWLAQDEAGSYGIFEDIRDCGCRGEKFISEALAIALEQSDADLFASALSLLYECAELSDMRKMPFVLIRRWPDLHKKVESFNTRDTRWLWEDLKRWYGAAN